MLVCWNIRWGHPRTERHGIQMTKASHDNRLRQGFGTTLLVSLLFFFLPEGAESNSGTPTELRPTHIDVGGNQDVIEKAFEPGTHGADSLSHARRTTILIGSVQSQKQGLRVGYFPTRDLRFTSRASAFLYAYPTPDSKRSMYSPKDGTETPSPSNVHSVWIVTCKHAVNEGPYFGVRINTTTGSSLTYVTTRDSWNRYDEADVAVLKFDAWRNPEIDLAMFEYSQAVEKEAIVSNVLHEGTPVALIGYPISMVRTPDRNFPVVQFGYIAQIQGYLEGDQNHSGFLIGGAAFPGNSGGPVLIPGGTPTAVTRYFARGLLLGMVCAQRGVPTRRQNRWTFEISQSAYLAQVVPMTEIHRAVEQSGEWELHAD